MRFELLSLAALAATAQAALPAGVKVPSTKGFQNPVVHVSNGGSAVCVTGNVPVYAKSTKNYALNFTIPSNQSEVTQTWLEFVTGGSPVLDRIVNGTLATVSGTYNISSTMCMPSNGTESSTVQILTHGIGFTGSYWDFAPGYSYVDVAAANGYATFFYDRLGTGKSSHPDPIQVVQGALEVVIANNLITMLRNGTFGATSFKHVVGTGHSFGSEITEAITADYPTSLDAAVLTGYSVNTSAVDAFTLGLNLEIAQASQYRFADLNNGYLISAGPIAIQQGFFRAPGFDPAVLSTAFATQGTVTFGEYFTMSYLSATASNFTGPITVVNGAEDLPFCSGNCSYPTNQAALVKEELYPKASNLSSTFLVPVTGHGINLHYSANSAFTFIQDFVKSAGL